MMENLWCVERRTPSWAVYFSKQHINLALSVSSIRLYKSIILLLAAHICIHLVTQKKREKWKEWKKEKEIHLAYKTRLLEFNVEYRVKWILVQLNLIFSSFHCCSLLSLWDKKKKSFSTWYSIKGKKKNCDIELKIPFDLLYHRNFFCPLCYCKSFSQEKCHSNFFNEHFFFLLHILCRMIYSCHL
jgi:hypothetical protein